jgi:cytochrome c oxidase subunit 2
MRLIATVLFASLVACGGAKPQPATPPPTTGTPTPDPGTTTTPPPPTTGDPAADGKALMDKYGCIACHSVDGTPKVGPTLKGYIGAKLTQEDGTEVVGSEERLRGSFDKTQPLKGFPPTMPVYAANIPEADRAALVAYVKSLK